MTDRHQQTSQHIPRHPMRLFEDVWRFMLRLNDVCWCLLVFVGVCWCLILSYVVWRCAEGVWIVSQKVSECCLWTCKCLGSCEGVSECSGLVGCSKCSILEYLRKENCVHLTLLKHQNTKTSLYKLSKNHWVITLLENLGPSEENYNLQSFWITLYHFF